VSDSIVGGWHLRKLDIENNIADKMALDAIMNMSEVKSMNLQYVKILEC